MSNFNPGGAQDLTPDEQILHHYAAMVRKDLEEYRTHSISRSQEDWNNLFINHLARFILAIHFYTPFSDSSREKR
jgi:hypothetical protein